MMSLLIIVYFLWAITVVLLLVRSPWLFLRPSVWISISFGIIISAAAVFLPDQYNHPGCPTLSALRDIDFVRLTTVAFPLILLIFTVLTPAISQQYKVLFLRIYPYNNAISNPPKAQPLDFRIALIMAVTCAIIIFAYLVTVPYTQTGLYAVFFNPSDIELAREESLKLLDNIVIKYSFSYMISIFGPLTCALMVQVIQWNKLALKQFAAGIAILIVVIDVMLPGERSAAALCILSAGISYLFKVGLRKGWRTITIATLGGTALVFILTYLRFDDGEISINTAMAVLEIVAIRIFTVPFATGIYSLQYAQDFGLTGMSTIRPLAFVTGVDFLNLPNEVMLSTMSGITEAGKSGYMNTSFFFDFQAAFGFLAGLMIAAICTFLLDFAIVFWAKLRGRILKALYAVYLIQMLSLLSSAYLSSMNTHGIIWSSFIAAGIGSFTTHQLRKEKLIYLLEKRGPNHNDAHPTVPSLANGK